MADFPGTFAALSKILRAQAKGLDCTADTDRQLSYDTRHIRKNGKPLYFGAVMLKKNYVSYHLMPVYTDPSLLGSVSPALRKHMQGKSCFNFKEPDPKLFRELADLTKAGYQAWKKSGWL